MDVLRVVVRVLGGDVRSEDKPSDMDLADASGKSPFLNFMNEGFIDVLDGSDLAFDLGAPAHAWKIDEVHQKVVLQVAEHFVEDEAGSLEAVDEEQRRLALVPELVRPHPLWLCVLR